MGDAKELEILRARVCASMPSHLSRVQSAPSFLKVEDEREEGELSSSDDDNVLPLPLSGTLPFHARPSDAPSLGGHLEDPAKDNIHLPVTTSSANFLIPEAKPAAVNISIVNKSQLLSGLCASAPSLVSIQKPSQVGLSNLGLTPHLQGKFSNSDIQSTTHHVPGMQPSGGESMTLRAQCIYEEACSFTSRVHSHGNGSHVGHLLTQGKKRGRIGNVVPPRNVEVPSAASPVASTPLLGAISSSLGLQLPQASVPAIRTEADAFLAGLVLPASTLPSSPSLPNSSAEKKKFIIKFDDSDSEGEQQQLGLMQGQSSKSVIDKAPAASGQASAHTQIPVDMVSEIDRLRKQSANMQRLKAKTNVYTKGGISLQSASVVKAAVPPAVALNLEALRQQITAKEKELQEQRNRVNTAVVSVPRVPVKVLERRDAGASKGGEGSRPASASMYLTTRTGAPDLQLVPGGYRPGELETTGIANVKEGESTIPIRVGEGTGPLSVAKASVTSTRSGKNAKLEPVGRALRSFESLSTGLVSVKETSCGSLLRVGEGSGQVQATGVGPFATRDGEGNDADMELVAAASSGTGFESMRLFGAGVAEISASQKQEVGLSLKRSASVMDFPSSHQKSLKLDLDSNRQSQYMPALSLAEQGGGDGVLSSSFRDSSGVIAQPILADGTLTKGHKVGKRHSLVSPIVDGGNNAVVKSPGPQRTVGHVHRNTTETTIAGTKNAGSHVQSKASESSSSLGLVSEAPQLRKCGTGSAHTVAGTVGTISIERPVTRSGGNTHHHPRGTVSSGYMDPTTVLSPTLLPFSVIGQQNFGLNTNDSNPKLDLNIDPGTQEIGSLSETPENGKFSQLRLSTRGGADGPVTLADHATSSLVPPQRTPILASALPHPSVSSSAGGVQVLNKEGTKAMQTALPGSLALTTPLETTLLPNNDKSVVPSPSPPPYGLWPPLHQLHTTGSQLESSGMQGTVSTDSGNQSLQQLEEEEDAVDKALEEARIRRRECEVQERKARRAYRDAQFALASANTLCDALSHRRKLLSAQVYAAMHHQPSLPIHSKSLVPFDHGPRITELSPAAYRTSECEIDRRLPEVQAPRVRVPFESTHGKMVLRDQGPKADTPSIPDQQSLSPRSVDTVVLEENVDILTPKVGQMERLEMGVHTAGLQEMSPGVVDLYPPKIDEHNHMGGSRQSPVLRLNQGVELTACRDAGIVSPSRTKVGRQVASELPTDTTLQRLANALDLRDHSYVHEAKIPDDVTASSRGVQETLMQQSARSSRRNVTLFSTPSGRKDVGGFGSGPESKPDVKDLQEVEGGNLTGMEIKTVLLLHEPALPQKTIGSPGFENDRPMKLVCVRLFPACAVDAEQTGEGGFHVEGYLSQDEGPAPVEPMLGSTGGPQIAALRAEENRVFFAQGQALSSSIAHSSGYKETLVDEASQDLKVPNANANEGCHTGVALSSMLEERDNTSRNGSQGESGGEDQEDTASDVSMGTRPKARQEISGLRALADNDDNQPESMNTEERTREKYQQVVNLEAGNDANSLTLDTKDLMVQMWESATETNVQLNSRDILQEVPVEGVAEKGDTASRTSISSEGETQPSKEDEGREEVHVYNKQKSVTETPEVAGCNVNCILAPGDIYLGASFGVGDVGMDGKESLASFETVPEDNHRESFKFEGLPTSSLSVAFSCFGAENRTSLCWSSNQTEGKKETVQPCLQSGTYESPLSMFRSYRMCSQFQTVWHKSLASNTWSHEIDPLKPLCKFESRGKCNNTDCPWQHVADYTLDDAQLLSQLNRYRDTDKQVEVEEISQGAVNSALTAIISEAQCSDKTITINKSLFPHKYSWNKAMPVPVYKIGSYLIKANDWNLETRVRCFLGHQFNFDSICSYTLSSAIRRPLLPDMPCLIPATLGGNSDAPVGKESCWRYIGDESQAVAEELVKREPGDVEAWLELGLTHIDFDLNCMDMDAYNDTLYVLSRALEANPSVVILWVVYISLFYQHTSNIGKDDLFYHAVMNSQGSYELLLFYINSRTTLKNRLDAYNLALQQLTAKKLEDQEEQSAWILDVVLQMLYCMCISGETLLLHSWAEDLADDGDNTSPLLGYLTAPDTCIMRVGCAYAIAYGHLPRQFLLHVGCKQQFPFELEWNRRSGVQEGSTRLVLKLMDGGRRCPLVSAHQESRQVMAVNHVQCAAFYLGINQALVLGHELLALNPGCLEVVLLVARMEGEKRWMEVFEQALQNWPKGSAGLQRLWNQYTIQMLKSEGTNAALHVLYQCASQGMSSGTSDKGKIACSQLEYEVDAIKQALELNTKVFKKPDGSCVVVDQEAVFAWMNLALFYMLTGERPDAQIALNSSMKVAVSREDVRHCWKEIVAFNLHGVVDTTKQVGRVYDLLDRCCLETRNMCTLTPLASRLSRNISKRQVRFFIDSLLGPAPLDYTLLNCVLETTIGREPKLTKDIASVVEAMLDTLPGNVEVLLPFCRLLSDCLTTTGDMAAAVWASSLLLSSLLQACPQAPEQDWIEAGHLLAKLQDKDSLLNFFHFALAVHPFSATLRHSFDLYEKASSTDMAPHDNAMVQGKAIY